MKRIRELRKEKGLTMKELGQNIGLAESTISLYESGGRLPDVKTLILLARFFNTTVDYIIEESDIKEKPIETVDEQEKYNVTIDNFIDTLDEQGIKKFREMLDAISNGETDINKLYQIFRLVSDKQP